jgi:hypothetical protein
MLGSPPAFICFVQNKSLCVPVLVSVKTKTSLLIL